MQNRADDVAVPVPVQAALLGKVAAYDRNLPARAGDRVIILILTKSGDDDSSRVAKIMKKSLGEQEAIAGLPHDEIALAYTDALSLAKTCKSKHIAIAYVTPGFSDDDITAMAKALDGIDVLTAAAMPGFVPKGIVLGFDLISGKPKLLVHLKQAKKQNVALSAEILKLMKVYE